MRIFITLLLTLILLACKSSPHVEKHAYDLYVGKNTSPFTTTLNASLLVTNTQANPLYLNNEFSYRLKHDRVEQDFYNTFSTSPSNQINSNTLIWLQESKLFEHVLGPNLSVTPNYILKSQLISINADYTNPNIPRANITLHYLLLDDNNNILLDKSYCASKILQAKTSLDLVKAWNKGLAHILKNLSNDIANSVDSKQATKSIQEKPRHYDAYAHMNHNASNSNNNSKFNKVPVEPGTTTTPQRDVNDPKDFLRLQE